MTEYIKRSDAIEAIWSILGGMGYNLKHNDRLREEVDAVIEDYTAADVWEVVHCADCAHAEESLISGCVYCNEMERARIKEGFCAWGERKTDDG